MSYLRTQVEKFDLPKLFDVTTEAAGNGDLISRIAGCNLFSDYAHLLEHSKSTDDLWVNTHWTAAVKHGYLFGEKFTVTNSPPDVRLENPDTNTAVDINDEPAVKGVNLSKHLNDASPFNYLYVAPSWNIPQAYQGIQKIIGTDKALNSLNEEERTKAWESLNEAFSAMLQMVEKAIANESDLQEWFNEIIAERGYERQNGGPYVSVTVPFHLAFPQFFPVFYVSTRDHYSQQKGMERLLERISACTGWEQEQINLSNNYDAYAATYRLLLLLFHEWLSKQNLKSPHFDYFTQFLADMVAPMANAGKLLERKKALILYGVPGTGKTHMAQELVKAIAAHVHIIQFHPSYSYEDFIIGIRPSVSSRTITYEVTPGLLYQRAAKAADLANKAKEAGKDPERVVLIIDEINRADLAKVLGEVMFCIEYRDQEIELPLHSVNLSSDLFQGGKNFYLPENLYIIGTMNHADRSISGFDMALRRRFGWYRMDFDRSALKDMILSDRHNEMSPINLEKYLERAEKFNKLISNGKTPNNQSIPLNQDHCIGHTYFAEISPIMSQEPSPNGDITTIQLEALWLYHINPLLEDYLGVEVHEYRDQLDELYDFFCAKL